MAYKISYKVASQQAEQLKNIAKDMDNYVNQINQIVGKLGNDELLQSVRNDLNKFKKQLEEEKTVLNLAGSVIADVIQSFSGVEKKSVGKVDKAKAHNRDFYKRPVSVASAGGGAAGGGSSVRTSTVSGGGSSVVQQQQNISHSTTNFNFSGTSGSGPSGASSFANNMSSGVAGIRKDASSLGAGAFTGGDDGSLIAGAVTAAAGLAAAGAAMLGAKADDETKKDTSKEEVKDEE